MMRAASMRFLLGRQPRLTQVPPRVRDSVITAVLPNSAALSAAAKAVEPEPRITRSNFSVISENLLQFKYLRIVHLPVTGMSRGNLIQPKFSCEQLEGADEADLSQPPQDASPVRPEV